MIVQCMYLPMVEGSFSAEEFKLGLLEVINTN